MRLIFFGSPDFAVPSLALLAADSRFRLSLVVSQPDRPVGRGRVPTPPPVAALARRAGIPLLQPEIVRDPAFAARLRAEDPDAIVVVAYGRILPAELLDIPRFGCVNVHASLLPRHRGASPVQAALLAGDRRTGVATMKMTEGLDEGPVYLHRHVAIFESEDAGSLSTRLADEGANLLVETLLGVSESRIAAVPQRGEPTYCRTLRRADGQIDWSRPADEILRRRRAYSPWPGLFTFLGGARIKILDARAGPVAAGREPGEIFRAGADTAIACGSDTSIAPLRLQREGKTPVEWAEFLHASRETERFGR